MRSAVHCLGDRAPRQLLRGVHKQLDRAQAAFDSPARQPCGSTTAAASWHCHTPWSVDWVAPVSITRASPAESLAVTAGRRCRRRQPPPPAAALAEPTGTLLSPLGMQTTDKQN